MPILAIMTELSHQASSHNNDLPGGRFKTVKKSVITATTMRQKIRRRRRITFGHDGVTYFIL